VVSDPTTDPTTAVVPHPARVRLPGISPRAYEHPADRGALAAMRTVPGFPAVLKAVSGAFTERGERLLALASMVRVGPKQYPRLHRLRAECAAILDIDPVPEMFVSRDPAPNAMAIGIDQPFIVVNTALVEMLDTDALRWVIGHELGHVLSGHALYRTLLSRLLNISSGIAWLPMGYWGIRAVIAALLEWFRKAELSCDRAGLLCSQDPVAALRAHIALAGAIDPSDVDTAEFLKQANDYETATDIRDSVLKLMHTVDLTHPLVVVRAAELQRWAASDEYRAILSGVYPRRDADPRATWSDDLKSAVRSYRDSVTESTDPLAKVVSDLGSTVSDAAGKVWRKFGNQ
jgi:Zn-dependent protease with chaperone function